MLLPIYITSMHAFWYWGVLRCASLSLSSFQMLSMITADLWWYKAMQWAKLCMLATFDQSPNMFKIEKEATTKIVGAFSEKRAQVEYAVKRAPPPMHPILRKNFELELRSKELEDQNWMCTCLTSLSTVWKYGWWSQQIVICVKRE